MMNSQETLGQLKSQSTWRRVFLSLATPGMYTAHYAKQHPGEHKISKSIMNLLITLMYITAIRDFIFFLRFSLRFT